MYQSYFQLNDMPFENTPDPRFFFASDQHCEALAAIEYTIRMRKGFVMITGEIGSGKTTVGRTMCQRCGNKATLVQVLHGHQQRQGLVRQVLRVLNIKCRRGDDHARMLERLQDHVMLLLEQQKPLVLFIDEAQTLSDEALEELRLLSNFDTATYKPVQVVLIGQPELRQRVRSPRLKALRQRIVMAKRLAALHLADATAYIEHRIRTASEDPQQPQVNFEPEAVTQIHRFSGGVPRLLNVVCDNCLLLAYVRETHTVTEEMVQRVLEDMVPSLEEDGEVDIEAESDQMAFVGGV